MFAVAAGRVVRETSSASHEGLRPGELLSAEGSREHVVQDVCFKDAKCFDDVDL